MSNISNGTIRKGRMQTYLGKMTAYEREGKHLMRGTTPTIITNPQSAKQMYQRLKFLNLNNFYRAVAPFNRGGWENRQPGCSAFNAFMAANLNQAPIAITRAQQDAGMVIVAPYVIASGSLPTILVDTTSRNAALGISDILVGELTITSDTRISDLAQAIVSANGGRFAYGDEIAFLCLAQYVVNGIVRVRATRTAITLAEDSNDTLAELDLRGFGTHNQRLAIAAPCPEGGYCWVHARKNPEGRNLVSTQNLIPVGNAILRHFTQPQFLRAAAEDFGAKFDDDLFLECSSMEMRRVFEAFGIRYRITKNESDSVAVNPSIAYVEHAGKMAFAGEQALPLNPDTDPNVVISVVDIDLLDQDSLTVTINDVECSSPTITLNTLTVPIPSSLTSAASGSSSASASSPLLTSITLTSDLGSTTATFPA